VKKQTFDERYPTRHARALADTVFDAMPLTTTLAEAIRAWEFTYLEAGGLVKERRGG
jgi:hypothetical protein